MPQHEMTGYLCVVICHKPPLQQLVICEADACSTLSVWI